MLQSKPEVKMILPTDKTADKIGTEALLEASLESLKLAEKQLRIEIDELKTALANHHARQLVYVSVITALGILFFVFCLFVWS